MGERELRSLSVSKTKTIIGRDPGCDLCIDNPSVSGHHARLEYDGKGFGVIDMGSSNGIWVNGRQVKAARLVNGAEIQIGKFTVVFIAVGGTSPDRLTRVSAAEVTKSDQVTDTTLLSDDYLDKLRGALESNLAEKKRFSAIEQKQRKTNRTLVATVIVLSVVIVVLAGITLVSALN